jgi:hypothetical protein
MFIFKPKQLHLDCFTENSGVYDLFPIVKGSKCYPEWWLNLPKSDFDYEFMDQTRNMKTCVGFTDFFQNSVCIRLWSDLAIKLSKEDNTEIYWKYKFSDPKNKIHTHVRDEFNGFLDMNYQQLKIETPWRFKCKEDVNWLFVGNPYSKNLNNDMNILPGILNFKYQTTTNIQLILKVENNQAEKIFTHNTPLVNLFPMSDKKIVIHNHLVSSEEYKKIATHLGSFENSYKKMKNIFKINESKCPLGFKK